MKHKSCLNSSAFPLTSFWQSKELIVIGEAPTGFTDDEYNRPEWTSEAIDRFSTRYQKWLEGNWNLIEEEKYINASSAMLMGMHNGLSTTAGLIPKYLIHLDHSRRVATIRSSDDSMTIFGGDTWEKTQSTLNDHYICLKLAGINISTAKTRIFEKDYYEFTSWYGEETLTSNYGVETLKLRPQAHSPHDYFNSISMSAHTAQAQMEINPIGAECMIRCGVMNVSRLWRIPYNPNKRGGVHADVLLLADVSIFLTLFYDKIVSLTISVLFTGW